MERWSDRVREILRQDREASGTSGSPCYRGKGFWKRTNGDKLIIDPGEIVGWILTCEER
jgi:hypothetical protein